jgi:hypothetical protein
MDAEVPVTPAKAGRQDRRDQIGGTSMQGHPDPAAVIRERFPGWTGVGGTGQRWAWRKTELPTADIAAGCVLFDSGAPVVQIRAYQACQC